MAENLPSTMPLAGEMQLIQYLRGGSGGSAAAPFKAPKAKLLTADELQNLMTLQGRQSGAFLQPVLNQRAAGIYGGSSAQLGVQAAQREIAAKVAEINMQQRAGNRDARVQTDRTNAGLAARGTGRTRKDAYEEMALAAVLSSARNPNGFVNNLGETAWSGAKDMFSSFRPQASAANFSADPLGQFIVNTDNFGSGFGEGFNYGEFGSVNWGDATSAANAASAASGTDALDELLSQTGGFGTF